MLLTTERALAFRCSVCGRLLAHPFSLFALSQRSPLAFHCSCGCRKASLIRRGRTIIIDCACLACDGFHHFTLPSNSMTRDEVVDLMCPGTGALLGSVGNEATAMRAAARDALEDMALDPEFDGYFANPDVMHEVLQRLQAAAEVERLSCSCGEGCVEMDIYPEKVELICTSCESTAVLYAEDEVDLQIATGFQGITLPASVHSRKRVQPNSHQTKG